MVNLTWQLQFGNINLTAAIWKRLFDSCNYLTAVIIWQLQLFDSCNYLTAAIIWQLQLFDSCNLAALSLQLQYGKFNLTAVIYSFKFTAAIWKR
jgi:hypothetical protein